jgi:hypothetical protein
MISTLVAQQTVLEPQMEDTNDIGPLLFHLTDHGIDVGLVVAGPKILVKPDPYCGLIRIQAMEEIFLIGYKAMVRMIDPMIWLSYWRLDLLLSIAGEIVEKDKHILEIIHSCVTIITTEGLPVLCVQSV